MSALLSLDNLSVAAGEAGILDHVSLAVPEGKIVGIVGGSGSGKTTLALAVLGLLPPAMRQTGGHVLYAGRDLTALTPRDMTAVRGKDIGMVFQEPLSAFDPLFTIGAQLDESLRAHTRLDSRGRRDRIVSTLACVELEEPDRIARSYPHELSGGLRQRAMIAQALVCRPRLILADEPTSSLDVTVQAGIMALLRRLNREQGVAIVLIAHDLGLVARLADTVAVMQEGCVVEQGPASGILKTPRHPYTRALLAAY